MGFRFAWKDEDIVVHGRWSPDGRGYATQSQEFQNALAEFLGMMLLPSPPTLRIDSSATVLADTHVRFALEAEQVLYVESEFLLKDVHEKLRGFFLLLPDPASLGVILRSVRT